MNLSWRKTKYGPMLADSGPLVDPAERLAPGVLGFLTDVPEGIYIGWIAAERPGRGDVGRYLDGLPTDRRVVFPSVISGVLEGMLVRRGFWRSTEWADGWEEPCDIWQRASSPIDNVAVDAHTRGAPGR